MSFLHRNGLALRGIAVFLTAYCVLASGRAMIPGLCATLADLNQQSATAKCCEPKPPCCEKDVAAASTSIAVPAHECAFCMLVHTAAQPIVLEKFSAPEITAPLQLAAHDVHVVDSVSAGCFLRRAPPSA